MVQYQAEFQDGSQLSLFGSDFFNDKGVFNRHHHSNLIDFSVSVCEKGVPISILDIYNHSKTIFNNDKEFEEWYLSNQSTTIDFGFGDIDNEKELYQEGLQRIKQVKEYLEDELEWHAKNHFTPWRVDGGYKTLELKVKIVLTSIKKLRKTKVEFINSNLANKLIDCFTIPKTAFINNCDLLSYAGQGHDKVKADELIKLLEINLKLITKKENEIISSEKIKNLRSWFNRLF